MEESMTSIVLTEMPAKLEQAKDEGKSCLFFDTTGAAVTFYSYKARLVECAKMQV